MTLGQCWTVLSNLDQTDVGDQMARVTRFLRFFLHDGAVYAASDVPAEPFIGEHVASVFVYFCQVADGIDSLLQAEFGGRTAFLESSPSALKH